MRPEDGTHRQTGFNSYSKEIHEALGRYQYQLFSLAEDEMPDFINARDFRGLNVTIPYKKDVIPLCDEVTGSGSRDRGCKILCSGKTLQGPDPRKVSARKTRSWWVTTRDYGAFLYAASRAGIDFEGRGRSRSWAPAGHPLMARRAAADQNAARIHIASRHPETDPPSGSEIHECRDPQHRILRPAAGNRRLYRRDRQYHTGRDFSKQHAAGDPPKGFSRLPGCHRCDLQPV